MTLMDEMCQEKKEEEDWPALKTVLMHRYNNSKTTCENMDVVKKKENLKRETESLLIAAQNNTIRNNHIKATKQQI